MEKHLSPIIKPADLIALKQTTKLILVDVRTGPNAYDNYAKAHLKGALFVDLETQLATKSPNAADGGRHPLPSVEKFVEVLTKLGISNDSPIITYDDKNASNAAARFWWMLKAVGHAKIQVIDGGLQAAIEAGFPMSSDEEKPLKSTPYKAEKWVLPLVTLDEVERATHDNKMLIIDVRDKARFDGLTEPIDLIAGHIPNATNVPFTRNLDENGFYEDPSVLKAKYTEILENRASDKVIVHCGSGVTACHTLLAMAHAGMEIPQLYVGSWSEWSRNDLPMVLKTQKY